MSLSEGLAYAKANSDRPTILHIATVNMILLCPVTTPSQYLTSSNCFISSKLTSETLFQN